MGRLARPRDAFCIACLAERGPSRVKSGLVDRGYRVPEPALLISCQSSERRKLYMANWLAACHV